MARQYWYDHTALSLPPSLSHTHTYLLIHSLTHSLSLSHTQLCVTFFVREQPIERQSANFLG